MSHSPETSSTVDPSIIAAICAVLDYFQPAEHADFQRSDATGRTGHIYHHLIALRAWVNRETTSPDPHPCDAGCDPLWMDAARAISAAFAHLDTTDRILTELAADPTNDGETIQFQRGLLRAGLRILRAFRVAVVAETG